MTTRNEQKEQRRNQILMAALDLFIHKGYAATKIADIAQAVGMSTGLLFHYFESKESLYGELVKMGFSGPEGIMTTDRSDPLAFFENAACTILGYAEADPCVAKMFVLMSQAANNEVVPEELRNYLKRDIFLQSAQIIRAGQAAGTIREGDPVTLSLAFWAAIQGICQTVALAPGMPCPDGAWIADIVRNHSPGCASTESEKG